MSCEDGNFIQFSLRDHVIAAGVHAISEVDGGGGGSGHHWRVSWPAEAKPQTKDPPADTGPWAEMGWSRGISKEGGGAPGGAEGAPEF